MSGSWRTSRLTPYVRASLCHAAPTPMAAVRLRCFPADTLTQPLNFVYLLTRLRELPRANTPACTPPPSTTACYPHHRAQHHGHTPDRCRSGWCKGFFTTQTAGEHLKPGVTCHQPDREHQCPAKHLPAGAHHQQHPNQATCHQPPALACHMGFEKPGRLVISNSTPRKT